MDVLRGLGFFLEGLSEEVQSGAILQMWALHADLMCRNPGPPDASVFGTHQSDRNTTFDVSARPRVWLPPLFCEAAD